MIICRYTRKYVWCGVDHKLTEQAQLSASIYLSVRSACNNTYLCILLFVQVEPYRRMYTVQKRRLKLSLATVRRTWRPPALSQHHLQSSLHGFNESRESKQESYSTDTVELPYTRGAKSTLSPASAIQNAMNFLCYVMLAQLLRA